jgi:hypothetical protein
MRNILSGIATGIFAAVLLYWAVVIIGLAQIAFEGRTGEWNNFWRWGAEQVVRLLR